MAFWEIVFKGDICLPEEDKQCQWFGRGGRQTFRGRIPFDAREIVASYGAHDWGQHQISEVQLSQRFVYDENGYYHCCGSIPIPSLSPV